MKKKTIMYRYIENFEWKEKISCMEVHTLMSINFHLFGKTSIGT